MGACDWGWAREGEKQKREVTLRFPICEYFRKLEINKVQTQQAKCIYCGKKFTCASKGGTAHLWCHIESGLSVGYSKRALEHNWALRKVAHEQVVTFFHGILSKSVFVWILLNNNLAW